MDERSRSFSVSPRRVITATGKCAALTAALAITAAGCGGGGSSNAPSEESVSVEQVANYTGADREARILAAAKSEGVLNLYTNPTDDITTAIVSAFEEKYPAVKVKVTQAGSSDLARRIAEEASAGRALVDVIETTPGALGELKTAGLLQAYKTPEAANFREGAVTDFLVTVRESYIGLGYNTDLIDAKDAPKTYDDLLDPQFRGKISIATSATGVRWVGALELTKGEEFIDKLAEQEIRGQDISGRALADFVVSGEVPLSTTIYNSHVAVSKEKGAPIAWQPLEPVVALPTALALSSTSTHPNAAMLFVDFALSKAGQIIYQATGYNSARTDMQSSEMSFDTMYIDTRDDYSEKYPKWEADMRELTK